MMSTDLIFSQPIPQNPSTEIQSGRRGPSGMDRSSENQHTHQAPGADGNNFLNTLKQVSQDRGSTKPSAHAGEARSSKNTAAVADGGIDEASDYEASAADIPAQSEPDQMASDWNFAAFIKLLENMGFHDATGESGLQNLADANPVDNNQMDVIKSLLARPQQNQFGPTADLTAGLERLQQFITNALIPIDGTSGQGLSPNQLADLAQINQWIKGMLPGLQDQNGNSGLLMGQGTAGVKPSGAIAVEVGTGVEAAVSQLLVSNRDPDSKSAQAVESADAAALKIKAPMDLERNPRAANPTDVPGSMTTTPDPDQQSATVNLRDNQSINSSASSGPDPSVVKMSENQIQSTFGEEPLSKILQEAQLVKEGVVKVESGSTEEAVSKVIKTDAGTNDNGLSNSAGHNMEKAAESAAIQKNTEASQGHLRNQTMDQIVRKAVIHLGNGQHEARIDLKPEFMGHIRMQVISENHLVTVKILAQHGFVKDMIESNVHQLKADLQQQGLEVDKLEVSVSRDSEDSGNFKDKFAQSKARQSHADHQNEDQPAREKQRQTAEPVRNAEGGTTVDYFA